MVYCMTPTATKELVRLLVLEHGQKKASELSNVAYETVRKWTQRNKWLQPINGVSQSVPKTIVSAVADELSENGRETKLSLSRYARKQAETLSRSGKLKHHGAFRNIVAGAETLHGWTEQAPGQQFTLNVLNINSLDAKQE